MNIQQATVGNVSLTKVSTGGREHLFIQSSDPLTRGFRVIFRGNKAGGTVKDLLNVWFPNGVVHGTYDANGIGILQHITVEELQTVNTAAFPAKNGEIG